MIKRIYYFIKRIFRRSIPLNHEVWSPEVQEMFNNHLLSKQIKKSKFSDELKKGKIQHYPKDLINNQKGI